MSDTPPSHRPSPAPRDGRSPSEEPPTVISTHPPAKAAPKREKGNVRSPVLIDSLKPGSRLGHFELRQFIGGGGMGRVYRAVDVGLKRTVALKILAGHQGGDRETVQRFLNEAQATARLNHENIAHVYFTGEHRGVPFIAFEYVEGVNLREIVEHEGVLPLADAIGYTLQIAEALAHIAEHQVVHRDVKPSNILITPKGRAKLIDLGLARLVIPDGSGSDLTASGVTLGTFDYISPEQARDPRNADARSDIYSLGCTLFYMLARRPPFPEGTPLQKLLRHQGDEPPDVRHFRPELPEEITQLLRKMLAKEPRHRHQEVGTLIESLVSLAEMVGLRPTGLARTVWVAPRTPASSLLRRHTPWLFPVAALLCVVLLFDRFVWSTATDPSVDFSSLIRSVGQVGDSPLIPGPDPTLDPSPAPGAVPREDPAEAPSSSGPPGERPDSPSEPESGEGTVANATSDVSLPNPWRARHKPAEEENALRFPTAQGGVPAVEEGSPGLSVASSWPAIESGLTVASVGSAAAAPLIDGTKPASDVPTVRQLVVDPLSAEEGVFSTLRAACEAARDGDEIELRFRGRIEEKPLVLVDRTLTITSAEGFRPVVRFHCDEASLVQRRGSMLVVSGGELTLRGVALELDVPRGAAVAHWSLIEPRVGARVWIEQTSLTIRNAADDGAAYHSDVSFLRLGPDTPSSSGSVDPSPFGGPADAADRSTQIELRDCIVRGEATLLHAEDSGPFELVWHNGLLVTTERLLTVLAGGGMVDEEESIRVELHDVTAIAHKGLFRFACDEFSPYHPVVLLRCDSSILSCSSGPMIEQVGVANVVESMERIHWEGESSVFESSMEYAWTARSLDPNLPVGQRTYEALTSIVDPVVTAVPWLTTVDPSRPAHTHEPADYTLDAFATETLGVDPAPGFHADSLPQEASISPSAAESEGQEERMN